jgi:hypothetical protein
MHLVGDPSVATHQLLHELDVARLGSLDLPPPCRLERLVADDCRWHDEARRRFVDVSLRELRVREAGAMAN